MNLDDIKNPTLRAEFEAVAALTEAELLQLGLTLQLRNDFLKNVVVPHEIGDEVLKRCWDWMGGLNKNSARPRCILWDKSRKNNEYGYRVSYILFNRVNRHDLGIVCHRCNGDEFPMCSNPRHLHNGTHAENMQDAVDHGHTAKGDRNGSRLHPESRPRGIKHAAALIKDPKIVQILRATYDAEKAKCKEAGLITEMASQFDIEDKVVAYVVHREGYKDIPDDPTAAIDVSSWQIRRPGGAPGDGSGRSKISDAAVSLFVVVYQRCAKADDRKRLLDYMNQKFRLAKTSLQDMGSGQWAESRDADASRDRSLCHTPKNHR